MDPVEKMDKRKEWLKQWIDDCEDMKAINYIYGIAIRLPEKEKTPSDRA